MKILQPRLVSPQAAMLCVMTQTQQFILIENKVEAVIRQIANWLEKHEKNGASEFAKRRKERSSS